jgi:hypothetical protein
VRPGRGRHVGAGGVGAFLLRFRPGAIAGDHSQPRPSISKYLDVVLAALRTPLETNPAPPLVDVAGLPGLVVALLSSAQQPA